MVVLIPFQNCAPFDSDSTDNNSALGAGDENPFICEDDTQFAPSQSFILSKPQYANALRDIFTNAVISPLDAALSALPEEAHDHETHERLSTVSEAKVKAYFNIAKAVANAVVSDTNIRTTTFGACSTQTAPAANCINTYLNGKAKQIFRRPLNEEEKTLARNILNQATGNYAEKLKTLLAYHLQTPAFINRLEVGSGVPVDNRLKLTAYEVAARLSFTLIDSTPDAELMAEADSGKILDPTTLKFQAMRLLNSNKGQEKVRKMLKWWANSTNVDNADELPAEIFEGAPIAGIEVAAQTELDAFINNTVFTEMGSFKDLMTSKNSYATHAGLANLYGHAPVAGKEKATMAGNRGGIFLRVPFLNRSLPRTPIIIRGVEFQKKALCNIIPEPNLEIVEAREEDALTHDELLETSNREAVAHLTRRPVCMSCHQIINPTGYAFEAFGPFGELRTTEKIFDSLKSNEYVREIAIATESDIPKPDGSSFPVTDAYDLVNHVANSQAGAACFTRFSYRYMIEDVETAANNCEMRRASTIIGNSSRSVVDGLIELIANEHFVEKIME